jgi:hypothetical protein
MIHVGRFVASLVALGAAVPCHAALVQSTFDSNTEGWSTIGDSAGTPTWIASGGNPGGHIRASDSVGGITWFFRAPAAYYGDRSAAYGGTLSFDELQFDTSAQYDDRDIILSGGGVTIWYDFPNNPALTWTAYSTVLDDTGGWKFGTFASPTPATAVQIQTVLSNLTDLQIRGEYRSGADTASLDNVVLTPEPSAALLGLMAMVGLLLPRRRRR